MKHKTIIIILTCGLLFCLAKTSRGADNKSGVKPQVISLPKGPGSIEGMGESFEPQLNTGSAGYSVKIDVPPGVNECEPDLALQYDGGYGNSAFGLGWDLSFVSIQRQTDKGQPAYQDSDVLVYSNGEELVPLADGTWRCENESSFMRFKRDGDGWEIRDKSGNIYQAGQYPNEEVPWRTSRIGKDDTSYDQTFKWYLDTFIDKNGNRKEYKYISFSDSPGRLYISEIRYNIFGDNYNSVTFDYEERPDAVDDYRPGFKVRTAHRCFRIRVLSRGSLVREYRISYDPDQTEILDPSSEGAVPLAFSLLTKITQYDSTCENYLPPIRFGYTRLHTKDRDNEPLYNFPGPEDVDLNSNCILDGPGVHCMSDAPQNVNFQEGNADFLDVNGDCLPDIIHTLNGQHYYYLNLGTDRFSGQQSMGDFPGLYLKSDGSTLADLDGDGMTDFVNKASSDLMVFYRNQGNGTWAAGEKYNTSPVLFNLNDKDTKLFDADFDKRIDVVRSTGGGSWTFFFNKKLATGGRWQSTGSVPMPFPPQIVFSNPSVHLTDMNGDRLQDVVWIRQLSTTETKVWYWPYKGRAQFDNYVIMSGDVSLGVVSIEDVKLSDINGDGLSDLIKIQSGKVTVWVNLGNGQWSEPQQYIGVPAYDRTTTALRFADMNGNGTSDLVWINALPDTPQERFQYLDFCGRTKANQLKIIDNGLGLRTNIHYKNAADYYVEAREQGNPWQICSPVPVQVVSKVVTTTGLDLDTIPGKDQYIDEFVYRDAYYDGFEKEFRGFAFVKKIERGDESAPTQVSRIFFHTGGPDGINNDGDGDVDERTEKGGAEEEPLKGMVLSQEITTAEAGADTSLGDGLPADDNKVFTRTINAWAIRRIHDQSGGSRNIATMDEREVSFSCKQQEDIHIIELGQGTPKQLRKTFTYDDFGNVIEEKNFGALSLSGDEVFTYSEYIYETEQWIVDRVKRQYITNASGVKASETRNYYDGPAYVGLALGAISKGNLTRQEGWVAGEKYINITRSAFDSYGNIISIMDGNGNLRSIEYDQVFHTFPVKETIHVGGGSPDLIFSVKYDLGFGVITESINFNNHTTHYVYDSFGRIVKLIRPGDSSDFPTQHFTYTIADPERGLIFSYDDSGKLSLLNRSATVSSVKTETLEQSGQSGTFDTIQYTDGMGRKLAMVEDAEEGYVVNDTVLFNAKGTNKYAFLPYDISMSSYQTPNLTRLHNEKLYDAIGREIVVINPPDEDGTITQATTQYLPLQKSVTDENNNTKTFVYDGLKRLIEVHDINNNEKYITRYEYDPLYKLTKITDAQNNIKTMIYDGLKRRTKALDPDCGQIFYEYDAVGNIIKTTDNKGQVILYSYDGANRLLTEDYLDEVGITPDITYHYDLASDSYPEAINLKGNLSWIEDLSGAQFFSYNEKGNEVWTVKRVAYGGLSNDYKTIRMYDAMDRVISITYPDGDIINYNYNNHSLLDSIDGVVEDINYTASKQIASIVYCNSIKTIYSYDPRQRLINLKTKNSLNENKILQDLSYTFDGLNNITAITDGRGLPLDSFKNAHQEFQYDDIYRLIQAKGPGYGRINFQYDKINNMIWKKSPDVTDLGHIDDPLMNLGEMSYGGTIGSSNRSGRLPGNPPGPHAITSTESGLHYVYDDNGNMVSNSNGDLYTWDFQDRLIRIQKNGIEAYYVYDYSGKRIIKKVNDGAGENITLYINSGYEVRIGLVIKYVFVGEKRIARIEGNINCADELGQQLLRFYPGWNFFSLEVEPDDTAIETVLNPIIGNVSGVWTFDPNHDAYKGYVPDKEIYDLTELHTHKGYLIKVTASTTLVVTGTGKNKDITLRKGWNLIGHPATANMAVEDILSSISGKFRSVWSYNTIYGRWGCYHSNSPTFFNDLKEMEPGKAYWVEMKEDGQIAYVNKPARKMYFYHSDHLGSPNLITDERAEIVESMEFYPFGMPRYEEHRDIESFYRFTGKELDRESSLIYYGARYYDPVVGRFISVDPLYVEMDSLEEKEFNEFLNNPLKLNIYAYVKNNPINLIDLSGLAEAEKIIIIAKFRARYEPENRKAWQRFAKKHGYLLIEKNISSIKDIAKVLSKGNKRVKSLIISGHGGSGFMVLGGKAWPIAWRNFKRVWHTKNKTYLSGRTFTNRSNKEAVAIIKKWLRPDATISLWGCKVAKGRAGIRSMKQISRALGGVAVRAYTSKTYNGPTTDGGGRWRMVGRRVMDAFLTRLFDD